MNNININRKKLKEKGLTDKEINKIIESEKDFEKTGKTFSFKEVKKETRKDIVSNREKYA